MYDYLKLRLYDPETIRKLLKSGIIKWFGKVDYKTFEIFEYPIKGKFKNFKFFIKSATLLEIRGSLHKFYRGYNHDDFSYKDVCIAIEHFHQTFQIDPKLLKVINIEYGVNIDPGIHASTVLSNVICFKNHESIKPYQNIPDAYMIEFCMTDHYLKIYDKGKQANIQNLLRIEKKSCRSRSHHKLGIKTLEDLTFTSVMRKAGDDLLCEIKNIVFDDEICSSNFVKAKDSEIYHELSNPRNWSKHKKSKRRSQYKKEKQFQILISKYGSLQLAKRINSLSTAKILELISK